MEHLIYLLDFRLVGVLCLLQDSYVRAYNYHFVIKKFVYITIKLI